MEITLRVLEEMKKGINMTGPFYNVDDLLKLLNEDGK